MLISHRKKFVFIHIYKTAGTSVRTLFAPHARLRDRLAFHYLISKKIIAVIVRVMRWHNGNYKLFTGVHMHAPAIEIKEFMGAKRYNQYFKFAFVRNPFDRMVSLYTYMKQKKAHIGHKTVREMSFTEFVKWELAKKPSCQWKFITDPETGEILVNYIGYFESLNEDIDFIKNKLNIRDKSGLMHLNPSKKKNKDYRSYYTEETKKLVADYFKKDLDELGYDFDGIKQKRIL